MDPLQLTFIVVIDTREMYRHLSFPVLVPSFKAGKPVVPDIRLVDDVFLVLFLLENPFQGVLFDVARDVYFWAEPGQCVGVGECIDDPFVYAAEKKAGVEAADIFGGKDIDVGE